MFLTEGTILGKPAWHSRCSLLQAEVHMKKLGLVLFLTLGGMSQIGCSSNSPPPTPAQLSTANACLTGQTSVGYTCPPELAGPARSSGHAKYGRGRNSSRQPKRGRLRFNRSHICPGGNSCIVGHSGHSDSSHRNPRSRDIGSQSRPRGSSSGRRQSALRDGHCGTCGRRTQSGFHAL